MDQGKSPAGHAVHELSYEELNRLLYKLVDSILQPRYNSSITHHHREVWAWAGELLFGPSGYHNVRATLVGPARAGALAVRLATQAFSPHGDVNDVPTFLRQSVSVRLAHESVSFVAFPYLEGLLKSRCPDYVNPDGEVKEPFRRLDKFGRPTKPRRGRLSSLGDAIYLFMNTSESELLVEQLKGILERLAEIEEMATLENAGCVALYRLRNRVMHGEESHPNIGVLVLTIALLIGLDEVSADCKERRLEVAQNAMLRPTGPSHPHFFYPLN